MTKVTINGTVFETKYVKSYNETFIYAGATLFTHKQLSALIMFLRGLGYNDVGGHEYSVAIEGKLVKGS